MVDRTTLLLLLVTCIWYSVAYLGGDSTPANNPNDSPGWWAWYDQGQYYKTTTELANGELKPSIYWFGYPLLGVPFYWLIPRHPYFIPNLVMVLILVGSFFTSCRRFMGRAEAWVLVGFLIMFEPVLRDKCLIIPWNTLPAYAAIYLSIYLLLFSRPTLRGFSLCTAAIGIAIFSRPNEIIPLATLYTFALLRLEKRSRWHAVAYFGTMLAIVVGMTLLLNIYFYGRLSSPYMGGESRKFSLANSGIKLYQFLCDGTFITGNAALPPGTPVREILERFPLFILGLPGAIYLSRVQGRAILGLFLAIIFTVGFYLSYNPFVNTPYFWTYGSYHYLWWIMPWIGFLTYLSFRKAFLDLSRPAFLMALAGPIVVYGAMGYKAVVVASSTSRETPLVVLTSYQDRTYTVRFNSPIFSGEVQDIRLNFSKPPSYSGTACENLSKAKVDINGSEKDGDSSDYNMSQDGNAFDFSFLARGVIFKPGDQVIIKFLDTSECELVSANLLKVYFDPGKGFARLLTHRADAKDHGR